MLSWRNKEQYTAVKIKMRKPNIKAINKVMFALSFNVVLGFLRKLVDC